jgi:hypothetical protein
MESSVTPLTPPVPVLTDAEMLELLASAVIDPDGVVRFPVP